MGEHIQNIFPQLSAEHREFLISGITPEEWAKEFPPEEEEQCPALNWDEEMKEYREQLGLPTINADTEVIPTTSDEDIRDGVLKEWNREIDPEDFDHEDPHIYD